MPAVPINPEHGRPRFAYVEAANGQLDLHADRDTKVLWIFIRGPQGGDRGEVIIRPTDAARLDEWLREAHVVGRAAFRGRTPYVQAGMVGTIGERWHYFHATSRTARGLRLRLSEEAWNELVEALRGWIATVG